MREPSWPTIIRGAIRNGLDGVHTGLPGTVISYIPATQLAMIQPAHPEIPPLEDVPILWPRGGGAYLHLGLLPKDSVWLAFSEVECSAWRLSGVPQTPVIARRHGLYAFAFPAGGPDITPIVSAAALTGPSFGVDVGARVTFPITGGAEVCADPITPATQPVALSIPNDANWTALGIWAGLVNAALNSAGFPVSPLGLIAPTPSAVLKTSG
jgi:hypothetical protein